MKYIKLGNSNLEVSRICLGCMSFGDPKAGMHSWTLGYEESKEIIKHALDNGINFFDTAMGYQGGTSEIYLGKAIKELAKREDVVIATKFFPKNKDSKLSMREHINMCLEGSLKRLEMDYVDLYILHMWDYHHPIEGIMEALHDCVTSGKVKAIGISNCYAWQIAKANEIAKANGWTPFVSVQGHYNMIFREEEREMAPYCHLENIAMTPYSALASGRLSKPRNDVSSKRMQEDAFAKGKYDGSANQDALIIDRVQELAEKKNVSMTEISLSWLLNKVESPIIGATKIHHIDGAIKALDVELTIEEMKYLEEQYVPHVIVGVMAQNK